MRLVILLVFLVSVCYSQSLKVYNLFAEDNIRLDGVMDETFWPKADSISGLAMIDPVEGKYPDFNTVVKIASDSKNIYLGIECYDPEPDKIISMVLEKGDKTSSKSCDWRNYKSIYLILRKKPKNVFKSVFELFYKRKGGEEALPPLNIWKLGRFEHF